MASRVFPFGQSPDLVFGNLEFALTNDGNHEGMNTCCLGTSLYIPFLKQAGFKVLNVANNHSWEYGVRAFWDTVDLLQREDIKVVGIPDDFDSARYIRIKGTTIAFLGCSARPRQGFSEAPGYNEFEQKHFLQQIGKARKNSDFICVSIHWGEEFIAIPSSWERKIAREMIDEGADVVIGHHPHVLREIERYKHGVIAYSLGNFICDMTWNTLTRETGCLFLELEHSSIKGYSFHPAFIDNDFFPRYLPSAKVPVFLEKRVKRYNDLKVNLEKFGYEALAKKALRRHQLLTLNFFFKNLFRYRMSSLVKIILHGVKVRIQR